jgi:bifunctional non-homologous end joining protein LigD
MPDSDANDQLAVPARLSPALATPSPLPPSGDWLYEIKYPGHRLLARVLAGQVRLFHRDGSDWTGQLPAQAAAVATLGLENSWLDGELVALGGDGSADFSALQEALHTRRTGELVYYLFDLPFLHSQDLRDQPLEDRRERLRHVLAGHRHPLLRFSEAFASREPQDILECAGILHIDELIAKRAGSHYLSERSPDWIKLDCEAATTPKPT